MSAQLLTAGESYFLCKDSEPVELNPCSGDALFPASWTAREAAEWREKNLTPGPEWPHAPGQ
jgi:hypothetical protein